MAENRRKTRAREEIDGRSGAGDAGRVLAPVAGRAAAPVAVRAIGTTLLLGVAAGAMGCAGPLRGPRTLGAVGAALAVGGATTWVLGERMSDGAAPRLVGFSGVLTGIVAVAVAGGWLATEISCSVDPDCREGEECREVPAPPGFVPYKQCVPR